ncbi:hypothetical protein DERF_011857 [Dermatophagoides farinae]|uniref:Uncharacterized protein n=1 Tax=Dermatophagoides farinae TaxID=6954 RepID=A0A922L564_DERFA|nr:hypothetical protein DERF_011857 [Dermatophagoides farinae]
MIRTYTSSSQLFSCAYVCVESTQEKLQPNIIITHRLWILARQTKMSGSNLQHSLKSVDLLPQLDADFTEASNVLL